MGTRAASVIVAGKVRRAWASLGKSSDCFRSCLPFVFLGFVLMFLLSRSLFIFPLLLLVICTWNIHYNGGNEPDATQGVGKDDGWLVAERKFTVFGPYEERASSGR